LLALSGPFLVGAALLQGPITVGETRITNEYPNALSFEVRVASAEANISAVDLLLTLRGDSTTLVLPANFVPTRQPIAWVRWEGLRGSVPPCAPIRYAWRVRDSAGNSHQTPEAEFVVEDPRFEWRVLQDDDLALWWYAGDDDFGREVFDTADRALARMRQSAAADLTERLHVVLYANDEDFASWHDYVQDWVGGEAYTSLGLTVQVVPDRSDEWIQDVIPHEVAHLFFYRATYSPLGSYPPSWLSEGYATYHEFAPHGNELRRVRDSASAGQLIPLRLATGSFGDDLARVDLLYSESLSAVTFLYEEWGERGVAQLLEAFRQGSNLDEALLQVTGLDSEGFQQAWWEWLGGAPGAYPTPPWQASRATSPPTAQGAPELHSLTKTPSPNSLFCCPTVALTLAAAGLITVPLRRRFP
jgi:hypothetical protein